MRNLWWSHGENSLIQPKNSFANQVHFRLLCSLNFVYLFLGVFFLWFIAMTYRPCLCLFYRKFIVGKCRDKKIKIALCTKKMLTRSWFRSNFTLITNIIWEEFHFIILIKFYLSSFENILLCVKLFRFLFLNDINLVKSLPAEFLIE